MKHMNLNKHVCKYKEINMPIKHKTHQILFSCLQNKTICINKKSSPPLCIKQGKHAYILKYFPPFLSIINKGVKVNTK